MTSTDQDTNDPHALRRRGPVDQNAEAAKAIRFLLVKAAIFIGIPMVAAAVAVFLTLR